MDDELMKILIGLDAWATDALRFCAELLERGELSKEGSKVLDEKFLDFFQLLKATKQVAEDPLHGASRLKRLRLKRGLTQEEVADKADISRYWYSLLEVGAEKNVSREVRERVCKVLNVSYEEVFVSMWWGKNVPENIKNLGK